MEPTVAGSSRATKSDINISSPSGPPTGDTNRAVGRFKVGPKLSLHVAFDLGRGDEAQPVRVIIPKDESYEKFLWRLRGISYDGSFETPLHQWEYILVNRQYEKTDPLSLTSSNTYYAMVSELLRSGSQWRHAVVRRSHPENPIIRAVAEGTLISAPHSPMVDIAAPDGSLPDNSPIYGAARPSISTIDAPLVVDASQHDASIVDSPMPDAPTNQATPESLTCTPLSRARVTRSSRPTPSGRTSSPQASTRAKTPEPSTPSTSVVSVPARRLFHLSSPRTPPAKPRSLAQPFLPLISSPLKNVITKDPPVVPTIESDPSSPRDSGFTVDLGELGSPLAPALVAPRPPATPQIASGLAPSPTPAPEVFQRWLNLPPRSTSNSTSSVQAPPTKPTRILRPGRPLWIVSSRRLDSGTEYQVHWNNGRRDSWEPRDSLYRDYPALVNRYSEGQP